MLSFMLRLRNRAFSGRYVNDANIGTRISELGVVTGRAAESESESELEPSNDESPSNDDRRVPSLGEVAPS